jgi:uncharacterized protein YndB with AHSA1/START domain
MKVFTGEASVHVDASPAAVFELITDVGRLPEWNDAIEAVVDGPGRMAPGSTWTVTMHPARGMRWQSVSHVETIDPNDRRVAYETRNANGNPSFATWSWHVAPAGSGADVTVAWRCQMETVDRKLLAGPIRKRQLAREVPHSLAALANALTPAGAR